MALKMPIIEIPISDAAFQKFASTFASFQEQLEKNPGLWRKVNEAILGQGAALRQLGTAGQPAEKLWKNVAGWSGSILSNTMRVTEQLLKWGTILGSGLLGGSLFGITRMASDVANYRRTAMGLGMSIGGMRSFDINMARLGDPGSFLSATNQALMNPALQGPLYSLGVNTTGSTEQTSIAMLKAMRQLALATPRGLLGSASDARGLGPWGGGTELQILKYMSDSEFARMISGEGKDRSALGIPDPIAQKWTNFTKQMDLAGATIFKTFVVGLAPLEKPLEGLSKAFTGFLTRLMNGPLLKHGIDKLADFLNKFSVELTSKKFQSAVSNLVSDTGTIAQAFHTLASDIRGWQQHPVKSAGNLAFDALIKTPYKLGYKYGTWLMAGAELPRGIRYNNPGNLMYAGQANAARVFGGGGFAGFATPQAGLLALGKQLERYRDRGLDTVGGIIGAYAPPGSNDTAAYIRDVAQRMQVKSNTELNLNDPAVLARFIAAVIRHENRNMMPYSQKMLSTAARTAIQDDTGGAVGIIVRNKAGASAVLAGAGLAGVPGT